MSNERGCGQGGAVGCGQISRLPAHFVRSAARVADNDSTASDGSTLPTTGQVLAQFAHQTGLGTALAAFSRDGDLLRRFGKNPLLMAPMAGVSDAAYRMMARAGGAALAYSEMVSVAGLHYGSDKTWELVLPKDPEPDIAVQLFGSDPEQFREAVAAVSSRVGSRLALIDINMACPVPKVTKSGAGSALLDDPDGAAAIVRACVAEAEVPVTVKIRRGRRMGEEVAPRFAAAMQEAGAAAVAVHGRYAKQLYHGDADWGTVERVVRAVDVPVIGSGDVRSHEDALRMMADTGCAAVMIARGSYGNPWVFCGAKPTSQQRLAAYACHVRLLEATGAHMARARSLAGWYLKGMPHAAAWRARSMECTSVEDYLHMADELMQAGLA